MVLKIHGPAWSIAVRRVAVVCKEKNVPYEIVFVDVPNKAHKSPEHLEKQPFGQVPYIDDDGFILYESRAIARYICAKYPSQGTPLVPTGLKANALFEQAASIELNNYDVFASLFLFEKLYKKRFTGVDGDEELAANLLKTLYSKLDVYEVILSKQKYLAGDDITLADLFHLSWGYKLSEVGVHLAEAPTRPNVARWWNDIFSRPSWQAVKDGA